MKTRVETLQSLSPLQPSSTLQTNIPSARYQTRSRTITSVKRSIRHVIFSGRASHRFWSNVSPLTKVKLTRYQLFERWKCNEAQIWSRDFSHPAALIRSRRGLRNRVIEFHPWNRGFRLVQDGKGKTVNDVWNDEKRVIFRRIHFTDHLTKNFDKKHGETLFETGLLLESSSRNFLNVEYIFIFKQREW